MALLPWDEEDKKKDELNGTPVRAVTSVQSGAWQPAPSGADAPAMGDGTQPAQDGIFDQQPASQGSYLLSEDKAQVDEAKRQRDAQIAEARRQAAAQQAAQAMQATAETKPQQPTATPKYMPAKGPKQEGGFKGFLKGVGAGIQQGLVAAGDVAVQAAAIPYLAARNGKDLENHMAEVEKVRGWLHNKKDITGNKFVGTQDVEQQALNIVNDKASLRDVASVAGKGLQVGLDSTMFMNPARLATLGALKTSVNPIVKFAARDAAFFGSLQGTATFQRVYGETGDMEAAIVAAAKDAAIGGTLQGSLDIAGQGVGIAANRTANSLRKPKLLDELGNEITDVVDEAGVPTIPQEVTPAPAPTDGNVTFEPNTPQFTPVADGVPTQLSPDGLQPVRDSTLTAADQTPLGRPVGDQTTNELVPATDVPTTDVPANQVAPVADGVAQPANVSPAVADPNMPTVKSEELRLKESRAGKSQAEEAVINQRLKEIEDDGVYYHGTNQKIDEFNEGHLRPTFLTKNKEYANQYSYDRFNGREGGEAVGSVKTVDFNPSKTLDTASDASARALYNDEFLPYIKRFGDDEGVYTPLSEGDKVPYRAADDFYRFMRGKARRGEIDYDAISVRELGDEPDSIVPINPSRAKIRSEPDAPAVNQKLQEIDNTAPQVGKTPNTPEGAPVYRSEPGDKYKTESFKESEIVDKSAASLTSEDITRLRKQYQKAFDVETNPTRRRQINKAIAQLNAQGRKLGVNKSESGVDKAGTLTRESPETLVKNDGWESYRDNSIERYETRIRWMEARGGYSQHIKGLKENLKALQSAKPNEVYRVNPSTGKVEVHPASELLGAFGKYIGDDVPPVVIGNVAEPGSMRRLPTNWDGADGTYVSQMSRLDYKTKNSVYHETMHHIDHFIRGYDGSNPKMLELKKLRDDITLEDMQKFKSKEWRAENKAEYVAHAMNGLLDGRIKAGELGESVMKYIKEFFGSVKEAFTSSHIAGRSHSKAEVAEYVQRLDAIINDGKAPNQKPLSPEDIKPTTSNLPTSMTPVKTPTVTKPKKTITPEQKARNEFAKRVFSNTDLHKDFRKRLARVLGLEKDSESSVAELLENSTRKVSAGDKAKIASRFAKLEEIANEYNALMKKQRKNYQKGKTEALDEAASKQANKLIDQYGRIERDLNSYVRKIQGKKSFGNRMANAAENLVGARNASILTSVGGVSRNVTQELGANILETFLHPIRMAKGSVRMPGEIARSFKKAAREYTIMPKTVSEAFPYLIGNTYRTLMSPVTGIANVRKIVARETIAESLLRAQGETPTRAEIKKFAGAMGADSEVVANNMMGILNGMTSHGKGLEVMRAYQEFIKTGSPAAKERFLNNTEKSSNLAAKLTQVASNSDKPSVRMGVALVNTIFPFVNTASNLAKTAVTYNLNPLSRSINDEILKGVRSNPINTLTILKNKAATYGVLAGVYALYEQEVIGYNDGEDPSKPKGIYIHKGGDDYFAVRATPIELPIAAVVTAAEIAKDVQDGTVRPLNYYLGILGNSLPYVDSATNLAAAAGSTVNGYLGGDGTSGTNDNGYAAKAYAVNTAKSFVPWSNNGITPAINNIQGKSTNAKTVYDKNMGTWLKQSIGSSYPTGYRDKLKDSRDPAGRARTVDQQGPFTINKTINDANTAEFNTKINDLVEYGREAELGKGVKDMFNTYDTGKNNNFKGIQDSITFLDAPKGADGKTKPDDAKKLEKNAKYTDLSNQIREGFYGETSDELLTLDGKNLYSDVSMPNADGTKNSRKPINMQSIKNAIAQTDLPEAERDRMYEISQANEALYAKVESKEMTYAQYKAIKAESEKEYVKILSNSKNYKKMTDLFDELDNSGFFKPDGLGSTRSGQTYLWNSLNALLGSKGATPAADYPKDDKGFGSGRGGGSGRGATNKPGDRGNTGIKWTPAGKRQMASSSQGKYTPVNIKVKLGNEVKKDRTQNYSDRSF